MNIFIKLLVLLLILACAGPFFIKGPDGRPLMSIDKLKLPELSMPSFDISSVAPDADEQGDGLRVYKWRDEKGVVHYSDSPAQGRQSKLTAIKDITVLSSEPAKQTYTKQPEKTAPLNQNGVPVPGLTTVPIADIPQLVEDARQVKRLVEERKQRQDRIVEGM